MKQQKIFRCLTSLCIAAALAVPAMPVSAAAAADAAPAEPYQLTEPDFFVAIGTYGEQSMLRYVRDGYAERVVWDGVCEYGEVFVAENEVTSERIYPMQDDPAHSLAYYDQLDDSVILKKVGSCEDLLEHKKLTITEQMYGGQGHWTILMQDEAGKSYQDGISTVGGSRKIDLVFDAKPGDVYDYAMWQDRPVIPLCAVETDPVVTLSTDRIVTAETTAAALTTTALTTTALTTTTAVTTTDASAERFHEDSYFVYVGLYNGMPQLRYFTPESIERVICDTLEDCAYGDVFIAENEVTTERIFPLKDDPVYSHSYYEQLGSSVKLKKAANCAELMQHRELTVTEQLYDGSGHWTVKLADDAGKEYRYGFNRMGSALGINLVSDVQPGDRLDFAFNQDQIVIPLAILAHPETSVVSTDLIGTGTTVSTTASTASTTASTASTTASTASTVPTSAISVDFTTTTAAEAKKITDTEQIREMFNQYIADNHLDAKCVGDEAYPQYAGTVVVEYNFETAANRQILEYAEMNNIERSAFNLVPCVDGKPVTTANPDAEITTTTVTVTGETGTDLPQTGNNRPEALAIVFGALLLTCTGAWAVMQSGIRRKDSDA